MAQSNPHVIIVGAGVAGLVLAQGLWRQNINFRIYEKQEKVQQKQGHRFRVHGSGIKALQNTLPPSLFDLFVRTCAISLEDVVTLLDAHDLKILETYPTRSNEQFHDLPIDRSWIRMLLLVGIGDYIIWGKEVTSYEIESNRVRIDFTDQTSDYGSFLVGADGLRSRIRNQLQPERRFLNLDRQMIWGRTPYEESFPKELMKFFTALDGSNNCVAEPIIWRRSVREESGGLLPDFDNYVYWTFNNVTPSKTPQGPEEKAAYIRGGVKDWHESLRVMYEAADHRLSVASQIFSSTPDIGRWETGRVTLIGDAAHPMSPMGGRGATTGILNAADLSETIGRHGIEVSELAAFEDRMRGRSKDAIEFSFRNGQKLWAGKTIEEYMAQKGTTLR